MAANDGAQKTKVSDRGMAIIPADHRQRLDSKPGDNFRWITDEVGFSFESAHQHEGVFDDFEPVDGGETNAVEIASEFGAK